MVSLNKHRALAEWVSQRSNTMSGFKTKKLDSCCPALQGGDSFGRLAETSSGTAGLGRLEPQQSHLSPWRRQSRSLAGGPECIPGSLT